MLKMIIPLGLLCTAAMTPPAPLQKVDLLTAIQKKMVSVKPLSNGQNSEICIDMEVKNLTSSPIELTVQPGTLFNTTDNSMQDIIVTQPTTVYAYYNKPTSMPIYGFCCQAGNAVPSPGSDFNVQACSNKELVQLAKHCASRRYDPELQQAAIWAVSDKHSVGGIYNDDKAQCDSLRTFTANLLHVAVPFYDVDYGYTPNTAFVYSPKTLSGAMQYEIQKAGKASLIIYGPDKEVFEAFYVDKPMTSGFYTQRFRYSATNMAAGDYTVVLLVDNQKVVQQVITL
jgi:hypothetical protein